MKSVRDWGGGTDNNTEGMRGMTGGFDWILELDREEEEEEEGKAASSDRRWSGGTDNNNEGKRGKSGGFFLSLNWIGRRKKKKRVMRLHPIDVAQIVGMRYFLTNLGLLASLVHVLETSDRTDAVNYLKFGKMATEVMEGTPPKY